MSQTIEKTIWIQADLEASNCCLHRSKRENGLLSGTVQTVNFFWDTQYMYKATLRAMHSFGIYFNMYFKRMSTSLSIGLTIFC